MTDTFSELKNRSKGCASMECSITGYQANDPCQKWARQPSRAPRACPHRQVLSNAQSPHKRDEVLCCRRRWTASAARAAARATARQPPRAPRVRPARATSAWTRSWTPRSRRPLWRRRRAPQTKTLHQGLAPRPAAARRRWSRRRCCPAAPARAQAEARRPSRLPLPRVCTKRPTVNHVHMLQHHRAAHNALLCAH